MDKHHVYSGASRKQSEADGLCVMLCHHDCHIFGPRAVHRNGVVATRLKRQVQKIAMEQHGWSVDDFRERYGRNYIDEEGFVSIASF